MKTPIADFVKSYASSGTSRFHMPGHKGVPRLGPEPLDITEIGGADVLYAPDGIIAESEASATALFGTAHSFYSTEGSSLAVKAMLATALSASSDAKARKKILAARNVHKSFVYACALLDFDIDWLMPAHTDHLCSCSVTAEQVEQHLRGNVPLPDAVYLTSPDYLGQLADIKGIARVCDRYGIPLLVDNAHGAYLAFLSPSQHPIAQGASLCCDSAHKTLPVLTGGAYLHVSPKAAHYCDRAREMLALFASTSPSYLILQSLDLCNAYLNGDFREELSACIQKINEIKKEAEALGISVTACEPLKLVINAEAMGLHGEKLAAILRTHRIEPEFFDEDRLVLMTSPDHRDLDFCRLKQALTQMASLIPSIHREVPLPHALPHPITPITVREALFAPHEIVTIQEAVGRICGAPAVSCPPAVPIALCGEIITKEAVALFSRYGIKQIPVVKEEM